MANQNLPDDGARSSRSNGNSQVSSPRGNSQVSSPRCLSPVQLRAGADNSSLSLSVSEVCHTEISGSGRNRLLSDASQKSSRANSRNASQNVSPCHSPRSDKSKPNASMLNLLTPGAASSTKRGSSKELCDLLKEAVSVVTSDKRMSGEKRLSASSEKRLSATLLRMPHTTPPDPSGSASDDGGDFSSASSTSTLTCSSATPMNKIRTPSVSPHPGSSAIQLLTARASDTKNQFQMDPGSNLADTPARQQLRTRASTSDLADLRLAGLDKCTHTRPRSASAPAEGNVEDTTDRGSESSGSDVFSDAFGGMATDASMLEEVATYTVSFQPGSVGLYNDGNTVLEVLEGGQAERAGVKVGWRITAVDDQNFESFDEELFQDAQNGDTSFQVTFEQDAREDTLNKASQSYHIVNILRSKPPEYDARRKGGRSRGDMKQLLQLLEMSEFFRHCGQPVIQSCSRMSLIHRKVCEYACSIIEFAEFSEGATIYNEGSAVEAFFILLDGEAEVTCACSEATTSGNFTFSAFGDLLFSRSLPDLQCWKSDEVLISEACVTAHTALHLASIPCNLLMEFGRKMQRRYLDFALAVKAIRETEPARRTAADVASVVKYLRWHDVFSGVPVSALANVAREFGVQEFSAGEVIALEGSRPENMLIVLSGSAASWRLVPIKSVKRSRRLHHFELNSSAAHSMVEQAIMQAFSPGEETSQSSSTVYESQKDTTMRHACIDMTKDDCLVRPLEWALAHGSQCSVSIVAHGNVEVLFLPRSVYLQFVRPFRIEASRYESASFIMQRVPRSCRTSYDRQWLLETPLSQTPFFRALPFDLRGRILASGRHRRMHKGEWLCHYQSPVNACHLILRGVVGTYTDSIFCAGSDLSSASTATQNVHPGERVSSRRGQFHHASPTIGISKQCQTLGAGMVLGEYGLASGAEDEHWPYGVCAEEDCSLLELRRDKVHAISLAYMMQISRSITSAIPLQTLERVTHICRTTPMEKRSIDHLEILCTFLKKYRQFSSLESHVGLELCQWVYFREIEAGNVVAETPASFSIVLKGELLLSITHVDVELSVLTVPQWGSLGELELNNGSKQDEDVSPRSARTVKATANTWLMCIETDRVARIISRSQKGMADRDRAIVTLRHTPPLYRVAADVEMLERLVCGNPFYANLEKQVREEVCRAMTWSGFDTLMPIVRQGDDADRCFVLLKGSVGVWVGFEKPKDFERRRSGREGRDHPAALKKAANVFIDASKSQKERGEEKAIELASVFMRKRRVRKKGKHLKTIIKAFGSKFGSTDSGNAFLTELPSHSERDSETSPHAKVQSNHLIVIDPQTGGPKGGQLVKVLGEGACFGEAGLLRSEKRNATIVAREHCECGVIHKTVFNKILRTAYQKQLQLQAQFLEKHLPKPLPKCKATKPGKESKRGSTEAAPQPEAERMGSKTIPPVLSGEDYEHLAGFFSKQTESRGKALCIAGKSCPRLLVIKEGTCKIFHQAGSHAPQEIGEIGVGQILGVASHILGQGVEPYRVVCASAQVELLRMEPNDVKTRIPIALVEAISSAEKDRQARLEQRALLLDSRSPGRPGSLVPRRWFKDRWLSGPFMRHKHYALMDDLGKCSLMRRMFSEWEPPGPEEDTAANRSILHYHLDDFVTDEDILRHDRVEEIDKVKQLLALPWHQEGNTADVNIVEQPRNGRGHRHILVKRHLAEQANESKVLRMISRSANSGHEGSPERPKPKQGKQRPQSAPGMSVSPWGVPLGKATNVNLDKAAATKRRFIDVVARTGTSPMPTREEDLGRVDGYCLSMRSEDLDISAASLIADMHLLQSPAFSPCSSRRQSYVGPGRLLQAPTPTAGFNFKATKATPTLEDDLGMLLPLPSSAPVTPQKPPARTPTPIARTPPPPPSPERSPRKLAARPMSAEVARTIVSPLGDIAVKTNRPMSAEAKGNWFFEEEPCVRSHAEVVSPLDDVLISTPMRPLSAEERHKFRRISRTKRLPRRHTAPLLHSPVGDLSLCDVDEGLSPRIRSDNAETDEQDLPLSARTAPSPARQRQVKEEDEEDDEQHKPLDLERGSNFSEEGPPNGEDMPEESSLNLHPTPARLLSGSSIHSSALEPSASSNSIGISPPLEPPERCDVTESTVPALDHALVVHPGVFERRSTSPCSPISHALVVPQLPIDSYEDGERPPRRLPGALNAGRVVPHGIHRPSGSGNQRRPARRRHVSEAEASPGLRQAHELQEEVMAEIWQSTKSTLCSVQCFARGDAFRQMQRNVDRSGHGGTHSKIVDPKNRRGTGIAAARADVEAARRKAGR